MSDPVIPLIPETFRFVRPDFKHVRTEFKREPMTGRGGRNDR